MPSNQNFSGVSSCYVFKSRLQEYVQKVGLVTPVYETIREGPSHEPSFRSTVIVNNVRYDSLPGFFNRKAAEQSAAEVALTELFKAGEVNESVSSPVHESGLCKNLLQEYAQKMNYAIPEYQCQKVETRGRLPHFSCMVEIGGIRYIGAAARTKKEAEIKVARTALLAIKSSKSELNNKAVGNSQLTVIPCRKRAMETATDPDEAVKLPKAKKSRIKKKMSKEKLSENNADNSQDKTTGNSATGSHDTLESESVQTDSFTVLSSEILGTEVNGNPQDQKRETDSSEREMASADVALAPQVADYSKNELLTAADSIHHDCEASHVENSSDITNLIKLSDGDEVAPMVNDPTLSQLGSSKITHGLNLDQKIESDSNEQEMASADVALAPQVSDYFKNGLLTAADSIHHNFEASHVENSSDIIKLSDGDEVAPMVDDPTLSQLGSSKIIRGLNQDVERMNQAEERVDENADQA